MAEFFSVDETPQDQENPRDGELLAALQAEEDTATEFYESEIVTDQIEAFNRYYGEPYGDEVEGRSKVVSRETYEVIKWLLPDLRRIFASGKNIVELEPDEGDDDYLDDASDWLNHVFFKQNKGRRLLKAFIFDGLLTKRGFIGCYYHEAEYAPPQRITGLNELQATALLEQHDVELEEEPEIIEGEPTEDNPTGVLVNLVIRRRSKKPWFEIVVRPPEDIRISARASSIEEARLFGMDIRTTVSDLSAQYPDFADEIRERAQSSISGDWEDERRAARFNEEDERDWDASATEETFEVLLKEDYILFDYDGDGYAERRCVKRVADLILENEEVDEVPYASWCPDPIPHRFWGQSIHDQTKEIEKVKTVVTRSALDGMYQAVAPRLKVNTSTVNLSDCLNVNPGAVIRMEGAVTEGVEPLIIPDVSQSALLMAEYWDKRAEIRTGVSRRAQALDPDALHDTAKGQKLLENAQSVCKEEVADNLAIGLEDFFGIVYRMGCKHQDAADVRINKNKTIHVDPRTWRKEMGVTVNVGLGTGAKDEQLAYLQLILGWQIQWIAQYGMNTPVVTLQHVYNTLEEMLRVMGHKSAEQYFAEPEEGYAPEPPPNPEIEKAKMQAKMQAEVKGKELEFKAQTDQAKLAAEAQNDNAKLQQETQAEATKLAMQERIEIAKAERMAEIEREKAVMEIEFKRDTAAAELALKREIAMEEIKMKREVAKAQAAAKMNGSSPGGASTEVHVGGDPG